MSSLRIHGLCSLALTLLVGGLAAQTPQSRPGPANGGGKPARVDHYGDPLPPGAIARLGTTRLRLRGHPRILGLSADGKTLLSFANDGSLHLLATATGRPVRQVTLASDRATASRFRDRLAVPLAMTEDGRALAVRCGNDVTLFDCATGKMLGQIAGDEIFPPVNGRVRTVNRSLQLSHNGRLLAVQGQQVGNQIQVAWLDTRTGKALHRVRSEKGASVVALAFTRDGKRLAFVEESAPGKLRLRNWDTASGKEIRSVNLSEALLWEIRFLPDGKSFLARGSDEPSLRLLDALTGKVIRRFPGSGSNTYELALSADGKTVAAASHGMVHVWDVATGNALHSFKHPGLGEKVPKLFLALDGKTLAAAGEYSLVYWDVASGKELYATHGHVAPVAALGFSPDGRRLVSAAMDTSLRVWDLATAKDNARFRDFAKPSEEERKADYRNNCGICTCFTPDSKRVLAAWPYHSAQMWEVSKARPVRQFGDGKGAYPFALSPDGRLLAAGTVDEQVRVWKTTTGKEYRRFIWDKPPGNEDTGIPSFTFSVTISPDGRTVAAVGVIRVEDSALPHLRLWELSTGRERFRTTLQLPDFDSELMQRGFLVLRESHGKMSSLAFSPNGETLALGVGNTIYTWDTATGKEVRQFAGFDVVAAAMALSPDGKMLAAGRSDGGIRLWRMDTGTVLGDVPGHKRAVLAVAFSLDGKTLASGSDDSTVLVWDVAQLLHNGRQAAGILSAAKMKALWADLGDSNAARAHRAMAALLANPQQAIALLRARLRPIAPADPKTMAGLLKDLDSKRYAVRNRAMHGLAALGELARPALEQLLTRKPALEMRRRVETLLEQLRGPVTDPAELRALRGIEVLERIGSPEARAVLQTLAGGAAEHRITVEARESLIRLKRMGHAGQ